MELLQLRYFYESALNQSFAKTAKKHIVPASSVSASIKRLEDEIGCKLFDRESNRIYVNENGKKLQRCCMAIFEELENTVESIRNAPSTIYEIKILILSLRERMMSASLTLKMVTKRTSGCTFWYSVIAVIILSRSESINILIS